MQAQTQFLGHTQIQVPLQMMVLGQLQVPKFASLEQFK